MCRNGAWYSKDDLNVDLNVVMSDEARERNFSGTNTGKETELGTKLQKVPELVERLAQLPPPSQR